MTPDRLARPFLATALGTLAVVLLAGAGIALADETAAPAASGGPTASGGSSASGSPSTSGGPSASGGPAISIVDKTFQPADLTIHVGDMVTWTVTRAIDQSHSVTSGSPDNAPGSVFDSGVDLKADGDSFSYTFAAAGSFPYFCAVHPDTMSGTITVTEAAPGGEGAGPADATTAKLIAAGVLAVALVVLFGWARLWRRMNPAP